MSTVKISQLPFFSTINANTANTLFVGVDIPTSTTFQMNAHILAQGLYSNEILNVGTNQQNLPNTIGQFSLSGDSYIQTNLVNTNDGGSADIVVTANAGSGGTDSTNFIDMGYANKNYQPGSEFNNIGTAIQPLDGYLYVQGTASSPGGNLIVGTTTAGSNLKFIVGGGTAQNVVAIMTPTGLKLNTQSSITFSDGTVQSTASNPANYSTAAFAQANAANSLAQAAYSQANLNTGGLISANANIALLQSYANQANANISYIFGVNAWQNTIDQIQTANTAAAFNLANTSVQNTATITVNNINVLGNTVTQTMNTVTSIVNGTENITGTLNVTGIVSMNAQVVITNTTFSATQSAVTISATANVQYPGNAGTLLHLSSKANTTGRVIIDSFGVTQNTAYSIIAGRSARGTVDAPTASQSGDILFRLAGNGYGTTGFAPLGVGRIDIIASENYTDTARGSQILFYNNINGSNTPIQIATFNALDAQFYGYVYPQKGLVYTPLVYPSSQTAITIDMSNNSVVRAQTATGLTVTLSNLVAGKEILVWITNTAGGNQTFTHGVSATNSTTNSTTWTIPGTSTILARYMCIDATLANTLVAITHA
jgi:hypothetical protein